MTTNGRQDNNIEKQVVSNSDSQPSVVNPSRRRFGKSGIAVSGGVLATLASPPVLGVVCKSPSGFLSGNLSTHGKPPVCLGRSPGYWKNHNWPIPNRTTVLFRSVFGCTSGSHYYPMTMLGLLTTQDDKYNLGMHLVAAYLNVKKGWTPFLTVSRLQSMWNELRTVGYFTPTAGVKWNAEQVVDYIQQTFAF